MVVCESCGEENPEGFRFCPRCGGPLAAAPQPRTERKIVTILFCDLVGFTAWSDGADPEDVRAILRPSTRSLRPRSSGTGAPWTSSSATPLLPELRDAGVETTVLAFAELGGDLADAVGANFVDLESVPELFQHPFQRV